MHTYTFAETAGEDGIKDAVRRWFALLAEDRYEDALGMLFQSERAPDFAVPEEYGGRWTPDLLRRVMQNYGLFDPLPPPDDQKYRVLPISDDFREAFERRLEVGWMGRDYGWDVPPEVVAVVHVDVPLDLDDGPGLSDMTARLFVRRVGDGLLALELIDSHVM